MYKNFHGVCGVWCYTYCCVIFPMTHHTVIMICGLQDSILHFKLLYILVIHRT